jgi:hypothetical protein
MQRRRVGKADFRREPMTSPGPQPSVAAASRRSIGEVPLPHARPRHVKLDHQQQMFLGVKAYIL